MPSTTSSLGAPTSKKFAASERTDCDARGGANLSYGDPEVVVLLRHGKPPLRFKGRRLTRHWISLSVENQISVELWQQINKGFVISFTICDSGQLGRKSIQVTNCAEATDCLENVCANLNPIAVPVNERKWSWADLHMHLCFAQKFNLLVADVLADWHSLSILQEHA